MIEINLDPGVVWLFGLAAFILALATGFGLYYGLKGDAADKSSEEQKASGFGFLIFAISAIGYFVLLVWLFNGSPALQ